MENLLALFAAALALMGSPGPATLSCAAAGAAYRWRAFPYVIGISLGTSTVVILVATGLTGLILAIPGVAPIAALVAGAYILYLAYKIATAAPVEALQSQTAAPPLFGGYGMAILNPKAYGAMGALFSGFHLMPGDPILGATLKAALLIPIAFGVNTFWMLAGAGLAGLMRDPRASRRLNIVFAGLLVVSVVLALLL